MLYITIAHAVRMRRAVKKTESSGSRVKVAIGENAAIADAQSVFCQLAAR